MEIKTKLLLILATIVFSCLLLCLVCSQFFRDVPFNTPDSTDTKPNQNMVGNTEQNVSHPSDGPNQTDDPQNNQDGEASFFKINPTHNVYREANMFEKKLPTTNADSDWWAKHEYYSPSSLEELENADKLTNMEQRLKTWDEVKNANVNSLFLFIDKRVLMLSGEEMEPFSHMIMFTTDKDKTVEEAIIAGQWAYASSDLTEENTKYVFGSSDIRTASQIIDIFGRPSEIYYSLILDGVYSYVIEYDLGNYKVVVGGGESTNETFSNASKVVMIGVYGSGEYETLNKSLSSMNKID